MIPLGTSYRQSTQFGRPTVPIRIGGGAPITVLLDTGSSGLRVLSDAIAHSGARGVQAMGINDSVAFGKPTGGLTITGTVARATVAVGGLTTVRPVDFQVIRSIACGGISADCANPLSEQRGQPGVGQVAGILGIGMLQPTSSDPVGNVLTSLPNPYSSQWTVSIGSPITTSHTGDLVLGPGPSRRQLETIRLAPDGRGFDGTRYWDDRPTLCWSFGTTRACVPTIFDTGSEVTTVSASAVGGLPVTTKGVALVNRNLNVSVSTATGASPFYTFQTGDSADLNAVQVVPTADVPVIMGVQVFYGFAIKYDPEHGSISVRPF